MQICGLNGRASLLFQPCKDVPELEPAPQKSCEMVEPRTADLVSHFARRQSNSQLHACAFRFGTPNFGEPVARGVENCMRRESPREGDERLSVTRGGKSGGAAKGSGKTPIHPKKRQRSADLGRALRSVYDDTLRETVPDEFQDLLGKLN